MHGDKGKNFPYTPTNDNSTWTTHTMVEYFVEKKNQVVHHKGPFLKPRYFSLKKYLAKILYRGCTEYLNLPEN